MDVLGAAEDVAEELVAPLLDARHRVVAERERERERERARER